MTLTRWLYLIGLIIFGGLTAGSILSGFSLWLIPIIIGLFAIYLSGIFVSRIINRKAKSEAMIEISNDIRNAAKIYMRRQIRTIMLVIPIMGVIVWAFMGWREALAFILGVVTSITSGYLGMAISVRTNVQTADLAEESFSRSFRIAVFGGGVMGLLVTGFSLLVLTILFMLFKDPNVLVGFGVGGSLAALFGQIGGGIFTKSADVGADLVGKVEEKIPEDDPRNAAVVADLVGDNVGDCAGRGADLFQTFSDDIITGSVVCATLVSIYGQDIIYFPILLQCVGIISSAVGILATRQWTSNQKPTSIFNIGLWISSILSAIGAILLSVWLIDDISIGIAAILGIATMLIASATTRHYAGINETPVKKIAAASHRGAALTLMTGTAYGLRSPIIGLLTIITAIMLAYNIAGGTILAILAVNIGTDLLIGIIMASDAFGPIVDNAAGIAKIGKAKRKVFESLSHLDAVGNTLKATTKSYAMSSGTITAFVLFATFFTITGNTVLDLITPYAIGFIFVGISLPYLMSSIVIGATAKTAELMVDEVRDQFRQNPAILEGKAKPNYAYCVDIATKNALQEMLLPGAIAFALPLATGFLFGSAALGALLIGAVSSSALLGAFFNNTGTSFDNAKKTIEEDVNLQGSLAHASAIRSKT
jgi:K(+)-stimulated pyrophosphate-energized sodium pump